MLPKKNRAGTKTLQAVFKEGKFLGSSALTFKYISSLGKNPPQISFVVPKHVAKLAVERNRLRRRGYAAVQEYMDILPSGLVGAFVFKKPDSSLEELRRDIGNICSRLKE